METMFTRETLAALLPAERDGRLALLADRIDGQLAGSAAPEQFWRETEQVVAELRRLGHDLWRRGDDAEAQWTWGWQDGVPLPVAGALWVRFAFGRGTAVGWRLGG